MSDETNGVFLTLPLPETQVFRYKAADDILELLYRNSHDEFMITQLRKITGHGGKSVNNAIKILDSLDLIQKDRDGRHSFITINQEKIKKSTDPILQIPQEQYREPIKTLLDQARDELEERIVGVLLFGSVARGEADRSSDIDIQIIVDHNPTEARRQLQKIRQGVEETKFDGNRYEIQLLVESTETAENYGQKLQDIFSEGITLYSTEKLDDVKAEVFDGR